MTLKELLAKQQAIVDAAKAAHRDLTRRSSAALTNIRRRLMHSSPAANRTTPQLVRQPPSAPVSPTSPPCAVISVWMQSRTSGMRP